MDGTGDLLTVQLPGLTQHFDVRCLSIPVDDLTPWSGLRNQTLQLIRREAGDRPVYLCGESFGACLSMLVASHAPELFHRQILINPASSFHRNSWLRWVASITPLVSPYLYRASTLAMLPLLASLGRVNRKNQQALLFAMRRVQQSTAAWRLSLLSHFRADALPLQQFSRPSLIIAGAADRLLPSVDEAQRLAEYLPQAQVHLLPHSGHACLLEDKVDLRQILAATGMLARPLIPRAFGRYD